MLTSGDWQEGLCGSGSVADVQGFSQQRSEEMLGIAMRPAGEELLFIVKWLGTDRAYRGREQNTDLALKNHDGIPDSTNAYSTWDNCVPSPGLSFPIWERGSCSSLPL